MRRPVTERCSVADCDRTATTWKSKLCRRHLYHLERYGSPTPLVAVVECAACGVEFTQKRRDQMYCGSAECKAEAKRRTNRARERRIFEETGEWRGRAVERANPAIVDKNRDRQRAQAAEMPTRKRYPASSAARDARRRLREKGVSGPVESFTKSEIGERDGWRCGICRKRIDPSVPAWKPGSWEQNPLTATIDHILPLAKGGTHTRDNVQIAHLECNVAKGDRVLDRAG